MLQFVFMISLSVLLIAYGFIAIFKKDWIWKVREFSARLEGKGNLKREGTSNVNMLGNIMGVLAILLGALGLVTNVGMLVLI